MSTPPDEPTRRLPPVDPPPPRVREREVYPEDDGTWLEELRDQVRSLRTAAVLLGILAVTALAIAAWALLSDDEDDTGGGTSSRGASSQRVSRLADRVDRLESRTRDLPSQGDVDALKRDQQGLADRVDAVEKQAGGESDAASQESADQLQQSVQDLEQRVQDVEQQQQQGSTP